MLLPRCEQHHCAVRRRIANRISEGLGDNSGNEFVELTLNQHRLRYRGRWRWLCDQPGERIGLGPRAYMSTLARTATGSTPGSRVICS